MKGIIQELNDILKNKKEWASEDIIISKTSVENAKMFARIFMPEKIHDAHIEVHQDGEVGFTWNKKNRGIINISFSRENIATWASYHDDNNKAKPLFDKKQKGRFKIDAKKRIYDYPIPLVLCFHRILYNNKPLY